MKAFESEEDLIVSKQKKTTEEIVKTPEEFKNMGGSDSIVLFMRSDQRLAIRTNSKGERYIIRRSKKYA